MQLDSPPMHSRFWSLVLAIFCLLGSPSICHPAPPASAFLSTGEGEWRTLFDGRSLSGWQQIGSGEFKLEKNDLVGSGGRGWLCYTREKFSNCQVRVVFKLSTNNDKSGVFIRVPEITRDPWDAVNQGYKVTIDNAGDPWNRTGCLASFNRGQTAVLATSDDWNIMIITMFGAVTRVHVNGVLVTDFKEGQTVPRRQNWYEGERGRRPDAGYIGLENHGGASRMHVKEVSVRPIK